MLDGCLSQEVVTRNQLTRSSPRRISTGLGLFQRFRFQVQKLSCGSQVCGQINVNVQFNCPIPLCPCYLTILQ